MAYLEDFNGCRIELRIVSVALFKHVAILEYSLPEMFYTPCYRSIGIADTFGSKLSIINDFIFSFQFICAKDIFISYISLKYGHSHLRTDRMR